MGYLPGVYAATKKDGTKYFRCSVTHRGKHISLGSFPTEDLAHSAYKEALSLLLDGNIFPEHYEKEHTALSFSKWVVLTNFANNGLYIKTPIYLLETSFLYYLSPTDVLHFDADDLFYYSKHAIMRRGSHLFVSDYGMQVNILSRYGIHAHSVAGRDYRFINGDAADLRYANIEVINKYFGVQKQVFGMSPLYTVKIHVNGDRLVGRYPDEITAAIAYNKAADTLRQKGFSRNHPRNYIEELSEREYHNIYDSIVLPDSLRNWTF